MSILQLPTETLLCMFDFIDDAKQLIQCSLVCKDWCAPATKAALGKPILIGSEEQAWRFFNFLSTNERLKRHVKNLKIAGRDIYDWDYMNGEDNLDDDEGNPCKRILSLVFHENLEVLDGDVDDDYSYNLVLDVATRSNNRFRLKRMPDPSMQESDAYKEAALCFKESLEHLYLLITEERSEASVRLFDSLGSLTCLTSISLSMEQNNLFELQKIVNGCPHLQELDIGWIESVGDMTREEVQQWFRTNDTSITCSLKVLKVANCFSSTPIEYLTLKYAKIEKVSIDMSSYTDHVEAAVANGIIAEDVILRLVEALNEKVALYDITFLPDEQFNPLQNIIFAVLALGNSVNVSNSPSGNNLKTIMVAPRHRD
ncbi:hypothetical protein BD408DRAFT_467944 [Parasitella parasitica]|nr:hypothetical protein BD408DRAFT_467944 [Parasitella parasitica]